MESRWGMTGTKNESKNSRMGIGMDLKEDPMEMKNLI